MTAPTAPSEAKTLLEFIIDLLTDADARAEFLEDPEAALEAAGLEDITVDELQELLPFLLERLDPQRAAHYERHCDDDKPARDACDDEGVRYVAYHRESHEHSYSWKPQRHEDNDHHRPSHHHHDVEIAKVVTHLNFVVNNYSFDSHDTIFNTTNTTVVWAKDSTVTVDNDTVNQNADDGGVVVGRDNAAPIVTGDDAFVGDGNQVAGGDANFGSGSLIKDNEIGNGAALAGGDANVIDNSVTTDASTNNSGNTTNSNNGNGDNRDNDQSNQGNVDVRDSGNDNSTNFADSFNNNSNQGNNTNSGNDNSNNSVNDSGNVDVRDSGNDNSNNSVNDSNNGNGNNRDNDQSVNDSNNDNSDNSVNDSGNDNSDNSVNDSGNDNSDNSVVVRDSVTGNGSSGDVEQTGLINANTGPLLSGNDTDIPVDVDIPIDVL